VSSIIDEKHAYSVRVCGKIAYFPRLFVLLVGQFFIGLLTGSLDYPY